MHGKRLKRSKRKKNDRKNYKVIALLAHAVLNLILLEEVQHPNMTKKTRAIIMVKSILVMILNLNQLLMLHGSAKEIRYSKRKDIQLTERRKMEH